MTVNPYINFEGRCDEAIALYKSAIGAEVTMLMRFKDMPKAAATENCPGPREAEKVMHAELKISDSTVFVSDGRATGQAKFEGISLSISAANDAQAEKVFRALSEGGKVTMPMDKTFFASRFGMCVDRFGVSWMVLCRAR